MTWSIRDPGIVVRESPEGRWYWELMNGGEMVAQSFGRMSKDEALDFTRWRRSPDAATVPIMGDGGILEP
jgi:hypothetical protein